jgi:hypothetical protein
MSNRGLDRLADRGFLVVEIDLASVGSDRPRKNSFVLRHRAHGL